MSLRSRRQRKAWGEAKRNPRNKNHKEESAREAGDSVARRFDERIDVTQ